MSVAKRGNQPADILRTFTWGKQVVELLLLLRRCSNSYKQQYPSRSKGSTMMSTYPQLDFLSIDAIHSGIDYLKGFTSIIADLEGA